MPSGFVFIKYADPPLTESSRDFFIPVTSNKTFQMRVLDISAIQSKRVTNSRWRDSVHVTPCVLTGILCSAGRISYCYRMGPVELFMEILPTWPEQPETPSFLLGTKPSCTGKAPWLHEVPLNPVRGRCSSMSLEAAKF